MNIMRLFRDKCLIMLVVLVAIASILSCSQDMADTPEQRVKEFAQHYFNLRYTQSLTLCTYSSKKWIAFKASNINQSDLDVINNQTDTATCNIDDIEIDDEGNKAIATLTINNVLVCDTIGQAGRMCETIHKTIHLKKESGKWYVDLNCPL